MTYVIGKRCVARIRLMAIPNLELQAVVLGVCLINRILNEHDVKIKKKSLPQLFTTRIVAKSRAQETGSVLCAQSRANTDFRWINGDTSQESKTLPS